MPGIFRSVLFLSLSLCACSPVGLTPETIPPVFANDGPTQVIIPISTTEVVQPPTLLATLSTPQIDPGPDVAITLDPSYPRQCGYQWAQKALPELSAGFLQSIQQLQPEAQATAFAFGEDCIYADGSATFIPMETDFMITLQVGELSDEQSGEWVVKIMQVVESIPPDQIVGPRPGRVSIIFESDGIRNGLNFYIDQYHALPTGLSNAEIYQALKAQQ